MHVRGTVIVVFSAAALCGCSSIGKTEVRVETGNQTTGYLSRPMLLTTSSDESVRDVAQDICDNLKKGSTAKVTFVGKIPSPDPFSLGDWGRYRYECVSPAVAKSPAPSTKVQAVPPAPAPSAAPASGADSPPSVAGASAAPQTNVNVVSVPAAAASAPIGKAETASPVVTADPGGVGTNDAHKRECILQQGKYHICLGDCLINFSGAPDVAASQCQQQCGPKIGTGCM